MDLPPIPVGSGALDNFVGALGFEGAKAIARWMRRTMFGHPPDAQDIAISNVEDLIERLSQRVDALEEFSSAEDFRDRLEVSLRDPDFTLMLQAAILAGARTASAEKHDLLAFVVAERVRHTADDLVALVSPMAIEAVSKLTANQLRLLGFLMLLQAVAWSPAPVVEGPTEQARAYARWLVDVLDRFGPLPTYDYGDVLHLTSAGCATTLSRAALGTTSVLLPRAIESEAAAFWDAVALSERGAGARALWSAGVAHISLTSVGRMIGLHVWDLLSGERQPIAEWFERPLRPPDSTI